MSASHVAGVDTLPVQLRRTAMAAADRIEDLEHQCSELMKRFSDGSIYRCPKHGEWSCHIESGCPICIADTRNTIDALRAEVADFTRVEQAHGEIRRELDAKLAAMEIEIERLGKRLSEAPPIPKGWVLVPYWPTNEMWIAFRETNGNWGAAYANMLRAAPEAPK